MSDPTMTDYLTPEIDKTARQLVSRHPALLAHEPFIRERLAELAQRAFAHGRAEAYRSLRTAQEVADALGISRATVRYHANRRDIGQRFGNERLFRPEDVVQLRRYVGQPPGRKPLPEDE